MKISREAKVAEAVTRLQKMEVLPEAIEMFRKEGRVHISMPPYGILYDLTREQKEVVQQLERERNAVVYIVVKTETEWGEMDSYIYVSDHEDDWEVENEFMKFEEALAYVVNHKYPDLSETAYIGWKPSCFGGIVRTA
ncbi:MAG: hypothetical protein IJY52_08495 [Anaerotignum sp.]|nr:hypothetical protein [Anaerotignum sp.]